MGTSKTTTAIIAALSAAYPTIASPQGGAGATGGLQVDLGIKSSLSVDDNFQLRPLSGGTTTIWDNTLTFGLTSATQISRLALTGSAVLRFAEIPGRSIAGLEDPNLRLTYALDTGNSRLSVDGRYRNADREFLNPFQVEQEEQQFGPLVGDGGTQETKSLRLTFDTGINDPIGATFRLGHDEKDFSGVVNPALFDSETDSLGASVRFTLSPITQLTLDADESWYSANDAPQTERDTRNLSVGLAHELTQTLALNARLGWSEIETTTLGGTSTRDGATYAIGLVQTFQNGTASFDLDQSQNQNGERTTLSFGRQLQLPNGNLGATLGLTDGPGSGIDWIATVTYGTQLRSSSFDVSFRRASTTNNQNNEVIDTRLSLSYVQDIDSVSKFDVTVDYGRTEDGGTGATPTVERTNLRAAYTRALTTDWNLQGGVVLRRVDDQAAIGPAESSSLFLTLDRQFSFRP
ncbi:MAG: hypothetical protein RLZZ528_2915 [Pseudomonadota bacterium]